jgi:hypothetical protein
MLLAVFQEFKDKALLERVAAELNIKVDIATGPCGLAKSEAELSVVARNAKLLFDPATSAAEVDQVLSQLCKLGLEVLVRNPITSAGCPMRDRVILQLP